MSHATACLLTGTTDRIPTLEMHAFQRRLKELLPQECRVIGFFGSPVPDSDEIHLNAVLASQASGALQLLRTRVIRNGSFPSLTPEHPAFHCFEREIHERYGVHPHAHPWLKPIRYPAENSEDFEKYPFYRLEGKEVHEVGVGPIHAGVIEPGHFRFMCYGETIHHLEIQLGYQHRGVEKILLEKDPAKLAPWIETVAGDSSVAHTWAYCRAWEALCAAEANSRMKQLRGVALELERIAMHLGGLAGMATDIGYQPGGSTFGRLRTTAINTSMRLCGSRFGRGWLKPGKVHCHFDSEIAREIQLNLNLLKKDFRGISELFLSSKTVRHRLKGTGRISREECTQLGLVGPAARSSGVRLDLRQHSEGDVLPPWEISVEESGDCWARARIRIREIETSLSWLSRVLEALGEKGSLDPSDLTIELGVPARNSFAVSLVEGWRGEVMHYLETDSSGKLTYYKLQDPSLRNWFAVALAVRGNGISDFPICNKSFDLSYCGQDL